WSRVSPFLQQLPTLGPAQKAAAVNLGIFPDSGATAYAYAVPPSPPGVVSNASVDRLSGIDNLRSAPPAAAPAPVTQVAYAAPVRSAPAQPTVVARSGKVWLHLASAADAAAL